MMINFATKKSTLRAFESEMKNYKAYVCGFDTDPTTKLRMFHQAMGVMLAYENIYPCYTEQIHNIGMLYYEQMQKVVDFYTNEP